MLSGLWNLSWPRGSRLLPPPCGAPLSKPARPLSRRAPSQQLRPPHARDGAMTSEIFGSVLPRDRDRRHSAADPVRARFAPCASTPPSPLRLPVRRRCRAQPAKGPGYRPGSDIRCRNPWVRMSPVLPPQQRTSNAQQCGRRKGLMRHTAAGCFRSTRGHADAYLADPWMRASGPAADMIPRKGDPLVRLAHTPSRRCPKAYWPSPRSPLRTAAASPEEARCGVYSGCLGSSSQWPRGDAPGTHPILEGAGPSLSFIFCSPVV